MTLDARTLAQVVSELEPLRGARVQRVDVIAEREVVIELRSPGRTLRLLLSARPGQGRISIVAERPPRAIAGGDLQRRLRRCLEGRRLYGISSERRTVRIDLGEYVLEARIDGGSDAFLVRPSSGGEAPPPPESLPLSFPASEAVSRRYGASACDGVERAMLRAVERRRRKAQRLLERLTTDQGKLESLLAGRRLGELLKPYVGSIRRGDRSVVVTDWASGGKIEIPLDPAISPQKNLERMFERARKADRGLPIIAHRRNEIERELEALHRDRIEIEQAGPDALAALAARMFADSPDARGTPRAGRVNLTRSRNELSEGPLKKKRRVAEQWARRFEAADGTEILVGKGARGNDRLTLSIARGDDVWLHASGTSGAHVIVRVPKGGKPGAGALADGAQLAAHYSGRKGETKVEVVYTEARHVRKRKGDPPGRVSVSRGRTILVRVEPDRLARLFGRDDVVPPRGGEPVDG